MRNCEKCFENIWGFQKIEGTIIATCKLCAHEVQFSARNFKTKKKTDIIYRDGDICKKCNGCLRLITFSRKNDKHLTKSFYFTKAFKCDKCSKLYFEERFKVTNKNEQHSSMAQGTLV